MDTFQLHEQFKGKLEIKSLVKLDSMETLAQIYTPNVGKICMAIKADPTLIKKYTIAGKTVAVISDGTAVLGFGNIGPKAALPVMEGKCAIFKELAGIDAYPICLDTNNKEEFIETVKRLALNFAAINLEDIAAPDCFEIENRLQAELDIPIVHDDQHGTSIVALAALLGVVELTKRKDLKIIVSGIGAAGVNIVKTIIAASHEGLISISEIKAFDSKGLIAKERTDLTDIKKEIAFLTKQNLNETFEQGIVSADVFIGVSVANSLSEQHVKLMAKGPIIFALANPVPEILPDQAKNAGALIYASGRSDFPNQINNALSYPGLFKGLLESGTSKLTMKHKITTAKAIFEYHKPNLSETNLLPLILDKMVPNIIADAIKAC